MHKKPNVSEIEHCRWWLEKETILLAPKLTVALGATALRSLIGRNEPIMQSRAKLLRSPFAGRVFVTIHPSLLLRLRDDEERRREFDSFVSDLALARQLAGE